MRKTLDVILVVEGKSDAALISSIYNCEIVTTNGYDIDGGLIEYLNAVSKYKKVVVLVDPDEAGKTIRERLSKLLNKCGHVIVDINKCSKNDKHGVAECDIDHLSNLLDKYVSSNRQENTITEAELYDLIHNKGIDKETIQNTFNTGLCNQKTLLKRLNSLKVNKEMIIEATKRGN